MLAGPAAQSAEQLTEGPVIEIGKRYADDVTGVEVLCTKAGIGPLGFEEQELTLKAAKPLPASD